MRTGGLGEEKAGRKKQHKRLFGTTTGRGFAMHKGAKGANLLSHIMLTAKEILNVSTQTHGRSLVLFVVFISPTLISELSP